MNDQDLSRAVHGIAERMCERLAACGWVKGDLQTSDGYCLEGVFYSVAEEDGAMPRTGVLASTTGPHAVLWESLHELIAEMTRGADYAEKVSGTPLGFLFDHLSVYQWNDLPDVTLDDVRAVIREAARAIGQVPAEATAVC
jgi:hypothetical protein